MLRLFIIAVASLVSFQLSADDICSYKTYSWNTRDKRALKFTTVRKNYSELTEHEIDRFTGCSVCEQDQRIIDVPPLNPFKICHVLAPRIRKVLTNLIAQDQFIYKVTGCRAGLTRGDIDGQGFRTRFSNHSFGIALDINVDQNGLYENCLNFDDKCTLIRGGRWNPSQEGALTEDSDIVLTLKAAGLKWGGHILGNQKDFMHFSPTGY